MVLLRGAGSTLAKLRPRCLLGWGVIMNAIRCLILKVDAMDGRVCQFEINGFLFDIGVESSSSGGKIWILLL